MGLSLPDRCLVAIPLLKNTALPSPARSLAMVTSSACSIFSPVFRLIGLGFRAARWRAPGSRPRLDAVLPDYVALPCTLLPSSRQAARRTGQWGVHPGHDPVHCDRVRVSFSRAVVDAGQCPPGGDAGRRRILPNIGYMGPPLICRRSAGRERPGGVISSSTASVPVRSSCHGNRRGEAARWLATAGEWSGRSRRIPSISPRRPAFSAGPASAASRAADRIVTGCPGRPRLCAVPSRGHGGAAAARPHTRRGAAARRHQARSHPHGVAVLSAFGTLSRLDLCSRDHGGAAAGLNIFVIATSTISASTRAAPPACSSAPSRRWRRSPPSCGSSRRAGCRPIYSLEPSGLI